MREIPFTALLSHIADNRGRTCPTAESGRPLVATNCISNEKLYPSYDTVRFVSDETYRTWFRAHPLPGDIIFVCKGSPGRVALAPDPVDFCIAQDMVAVRADANQVYPRYLFAVLRSQTVQDRIGNLHVGTLIPHFKKGDFDKLDIPVPGRHAQEFIGDTYFELSDKIEQNRRTGAKLEGLARAVFKAWFVDFEPVKAKAAGATAFPGMPPETFAALPNTFQDSPLGPVPLGWEVNTAGELASFILGGDWGKDTPTEETPDSALCIRGADIPDLWANGLGKMPVRYLKRGSLQKRSLRAGDIAVEISGGSPTQSTGRPVLVTNALLAELAHPLVCSNFCRIFRPKQHHTNFAYFLLRWMYDADQFLQYENGTTGIKNFAFTKFCEVHPVVMPHEALLASFDAWIEPLMRAMAHGGSESRQLAALRDYLLPRLLSGRVRVRGEIT